MGILLSAMAGAGDAGVQSMNQNIAQLNAQDLEAQRAELAEQKAKSLATFQNQLSIDTANAQRQAQSDRIGAAQQGIIGGILNQKYGDPSTQDTGNDDGGLMPDKQSLADAARAQELQALQSDPHTFIKAAMATGDLDPKTVAAMTDKTDIAQMRGEQYAARTEMMQKLQEIRGEYALQAKELQLQAVREKAANGKVDTATGRMLITSEDANIKAATTQIQLFTRQLGDLGTGAKDKDARAAIQSQIEEARASIKTSQDTKNLYMKQLGYPTSDDVKPATPTPKPGAPAPAPGMPQPNLAAPPAPLPATKDALRVGTVYNTARGPALWDGSAFTAMGH